MDSTYEILQGCRRQRVSSGEVEPLLADGSDRQLWLVWSQLGDFDSLEYAWWLRRDREKLQAAGVTVRAVGIGDRAAGQKFCAYTGYDPAALWVDPTAELHRQLGLYQGLNWRLPGLAAGQNAWLNLMLMCAGIGSPGTLREVLRGYVGDRAAPQLIGADEEVRAAPLPTLKGSFFDVAGGKGFQRPFELATLRLRNMVEVLQDWGGYVPNSSYLTQRGGTFLFDRSGNLLYEHRDRGILGFSETMADPLSFLWHADRWVEVGDEQS
jgi:AhpC/TSA antioxidant enzyme